VRPEPAPQPVQGSPQGPGRRCYIQPLALRHAEAMPAAPGGRQARPQEHLLLACLEATFTLGQIYQGVF